MDHYDNTEYGAEAGLHALTSMDAYRSLKEEQQSPRTLNASHSGMTFEESVSHMNGNSLGLLDRFGSSYPASSSVAMSHSQSTPAFNFGHAQGPFGSRRGSFSSASSFSFSADHASDSTTQQDLCSPRSFKASESPAGLPSSLSISGLAISTPGTPGHPNLHGYQQELMGSPFAPGQHDALLAMSHGRNDSGSEMLPPMVKRRAIQSLDANMLHSHEFDQHHRAAVAQHNESDETTPMPPSMGTFRGHQATNLSDSFRSSQIPLTPVHTTHRVSFSGPIFHPYTPGQSHSSSTTPEHSIKSIGSNHPSPFYSSSMAPRLERLDSYHSEASSNASDNGASYGSASPHSKEPPALLTLSNLNSPKKDQAFGKNLLFRDQPHSPHSISSHRGSMPEVSPSMSAPAMARVTSAPVPDFSRSTSTSEASSLSSFPSAGAYYMRKGIYPSTPGGAPPHYDPYFSAPVMSNSRSSFSSLGSPATISPNSLLDGRSRSMSGSVGRNTLCSRARNTGPPLIVSSADKLHVCHCGKRFKRMEHLKRHNRTHTQERPYKCPVEFCGKFFGRSDNLAQHLKTHFRPAGFTGRSSEILSSATSHKEFKHNEPRHNPHAAAQSAAAAAAAAAQVGKKGNISQSALGGSITLSKLQQRQVLTPTGGVSANASPLQLVPQS